MEKAARLYVRCHAAELARWKACALAHHLSLSSYARSCLNKGPAMSRILKIDPAFIRQIAAIGNNLNQIARRVNIHLESRDRLMLEQALAAIRHDLEKTLRILEGKNAD